MTKSQRKKNADKWVRMHTIKKGSKWFLRLPNEEQVAFTRGRKMNKNAEEYQRRETEFNRQRLLNKK